MKSKESNHNNLSSYQNKIKSNNQVFHQMKQMQDNYVANTQQSPMKNTKSKKGGDHL